MPRLLPVPRETFWIGLYLAPLLAITTCFLIAVLIGTWRSARPLYSALGFVAFAAGGALTIFALPPIGNELDRLTRMVAALCLIGLAVLVEGGLRQSAHQPSWLLPCIAAACAAVYAFWWVAALSVFSMNACRTMKCTGAAVAGRLEVDSQFPPPSDFERHPNLPSNTQPNQKRGLPLILTLALAFAQLSSPQLLADESCACDHQFFGKPVGYTPAEWKMPSDALERLNQAVASAPSETKLYFACPRTYAALTYTHDDGFRFLVCPKSWSAFRPSRISLPEMRRRLMNLAEIEALLDSPSVLMGAMDARITAFVGDGDYGAPLQKDGAPRVKDGG